MNKCRSSFFGHKASCPDTKQENISLMERRAIKEMIENRWKELLMTEAEQQKKLKKKIQTATNSPRIQTFSGKKDTGKQAKSKFSIMHDIRSETSSQIFEQLSQRKKGSLVIAQKLEEIEEKNKLLQEKIEMETSNTQRSLDTYYQKCIGV